MHVVQYTDAELLHKSNLKMFSLNVVSIPFFCSFISFSMKSQGTALMMAAGGGHLEVVKALIEAGADVNLRDVVGYLVNAYVTESNSKSAC